MRRVVAVALVLALHLPLQPAAAQSVAWQEWQHQAGIVDLAGPRSDGSLVAAAAGKLYLVTPQGGSTPFAQGDGGFSGSVDGEPYLVVAQAAHVDQAECDFNQDDVFILDLLSSPPGLQRVDPSGHASAFASIPGAETLGGIVQDTTGSFDHRLLVTGTRQNQTLVSAVDCQGGVTTLTSSAPTIEGGLAVAPSTFGQYAGDLIAPDENSGQVWAIAPDGSVKLILVSSLPAGGDTGVESAGFVPPGFTTAYLADRATPNNPFPGTDSILRLDGQTLAAQGVQPGDLLIAAEGGGNTVRIRCAETCTETLLAQGPAGGKVGHIEGHLAFVSAP